MLPTGLVPWYCWPCDWKALVPIGELPPVCPFCLRCLEAVRDSDGVDILES